MADNGYGYSTYSFAALPVVLQHPGFGQFTFQGEGLGEVAFSWNQDLGQIEQNADGTSMISKLEGNHGTVTLTVAQTSEAAKWLTKFVRYIKSAPADQFALGSLAAESDFMGVSHTATGLFPQKMPDEGFQAAGQKRAFVFLCNDLD